MSQTPAEDFARYLTAYVREMGLGSEDPADVLDRYHTAEIEWFTDGLRLDRERLIAHARPARRNAVSAEVDVHDVIVVGDRIAARYTLRATLRKGREVVTDIYSFARTAPDGRISRIDQITRTTEPDRPPAAPR
jgi:hypothetical protein